MRFWLDAHLSPELAPQMGSRFGVDVEAIKYLGLRDAGDDELFDAARRFRDIVIVTKDADFATLVRQRGSPPQVVWLTCGNLTNLELIVLLAKRFTAALEQLRAGESIVEISDAE